MSCTRLLSLSTGYLFNDPLEDTEIFRSCLLALASERYLFNDPLEDTEIVL